jgi:thiol reductant ABC exporter CydC subunit
MGFLQPQRGVIRVGDRFLNDIPTGEWRSQVAWVPQNPYLFQGTLAENLRLARPGATQEELQQAAALANLHDFILDLPDGYATWVGERGIGLSGGQARRLALARAFLKDAPFLILDEATANLDPEQEALIQESLQRLVSQRTVLIIAHRLNTVKQADLIVVLDQGRVVEAGSHNALLQQGGLYRELIGDLPAYTNSHSITQAGSSSSGDPAGSRQALQASSHAQQDWASAVLASTLPGNEPVITTPFPSGEASGRPPASQWKNLQRLLRLARPYSGWVALSVLTGFAAIACGIGLMATSAYILSAAALKPSIAELQVAIVGVRFFGIGRGVFRYLERNLSHEVTFRLLGNLRRSFYQALEPLVPARLLQLHSGDLLARIHSDILALENFYVRVMAPPLVAVLVAVVVSLWLGSLSPILALALAGVWVLAGIGLPLMIHLLVRKSSRECVQDRARLNTALVDSVQGMADLAIFDLTGQYAKRFQSLNQDLIDGQRRVARLGAVQTALSGALAHLGMWIVLLLAIPMVMDGQIDGVYLATLVLAALASFEAFIPLPQAAQHLESSLQSAQRLYEIVDAEPEIHEPARPLPIPERLELNLQKVSFAYPASRAAVQPAGHSHGGTSLPALSELSFRLAPGKRLAVVGPSGAGKSTLAGLLLRFWEPKSGEIWVREECGVEDYLAADSAGWREVSNYDSYNLRSRIGVLSQNTYLFAASLRDNLRLARPKATQAEIEGAAHQAQLQSWIESLPEGYDTWVGEQGLRLSAGERQRVAIARLLLQDAPVFILDEPTANLDALNERLILQELLSIGAGRSLLLITHRLVGLEDFDEILVLHRGRVVQRGTSAALLGQPGYFRQMWELQSGVLPNTTMEG